MVSTAVKKEATKVPAKKTIASLTENPEQEALETTVDQVEQTRPSSIPNEVGSYLNSIGVVLDEEQRKQVNLHLRLKQARAGNLYVRTDVIYDDAKMKLPNQAQTLLAGLDGAEGRTTNEWIKALEGILVTNQPPERVVNFYKRRLETLGLIKRL